LDNQEGVMADLLSALLLVSASFGVVAAAVGLVWLWQKWSQFYRKQYWKFWSRQQPQGGVNPYNLYCWQPIGNFYFYACRHGSNQKPQ